MKTSKLNWYFIILSFLCAISAYPMSMIFQSMAYWGTGMIWYWIGVVITYSILLVGVYLSFKVPIKNNDKISLLRLGIRIILSTSLVLGFLWTTFIIIAGKSGM